MTTYDHDAERIAAGLTGGERRALLHLREGREWGVNEPTARHLLRLERRDQPLATHPPRSIVWSLTPLGQQVRAILAKDPA